MRRTPDVCKEHGKRLAIYDAQHRFITQQATIPVDEMNITLEEQIEYMRRHLDYCLEYPVGKDGKISAAILATLEAVRDGHKEKVEK